MHVLRLILVVLAIVAFALFAIPNWTPVSLVFGPTEVLIRLPVLLLLAGLVGFVPMWIAHRYARGRWTARSLATPVAKPCPPSLAQPIVVPPAGA